MKNIHVLPTDKPSRLLINNLLQGKLELSKEVLIGSNTAQHIYITSDEEIKEGDWCLDLRDNSVFKIKLPINGVGLICKIILTTDQELSSNGVQAIDDNFLQWFVKNPSCESVEVEEVYPLNCCIQKEGKTKMNNGCMERNRCLNYKIIIPK